MSIFKNKEKKLTEQFKDLMEEMIGVDCLGYSIDNPAPYSALAQIRQSKIDSDNNRQLLHMLLDELGYTIEEAQTRIVKKED